MHHRLLDLLYPERCPACDAFVDEAGLCARCAASLYPLGPACPRCAEPQASPSPLLCHRCQQHPPAYAVVHAPWRYGGELATAVRRWKYGGDRDSGRPELTRSLVPLFAPVLEVARRDIDLVVPVPLHPARFRQLGFAPAARLLDACRTPHAALLRRTRPTAPQASLSRRERQDNVADAFVATGTPPPRILLVDDVLTTGATAHAAARAIRQAGARHVEVLVLARAEGSA